MALIASGADTTKLLTVDPVSLAARVSLYDTSGNPLATLPVSVAGALSVQQSAAANLLATVTQGPAGASAWKVDGSGVTQPVSIAAAVTVNQGAANATPWNENLAQVGGSAVSLGQKLAAASVPVVLASDQSSTPIAATLVVAAAASNTPVGSVSLGNSLGKTNVLKTGALTSAAVTANQTVVTYTVTTGKTLYLMGFTMFCRLGTMAATATNFGTASLLVGGTLAPTENLAGGAGASQYVSYTFEEPIPIPSGTVLSVVCTPSASTSFVWTANLYGYEK